MTFKIFFHPDFNCWYRSFNGSTFGCCLRVADFTASGDFHPAPEILTYTNIRKISYGCTPGCVQSVPGTKHCPNVPQLEKYSRPGTKKPRNVPLTLRGLIFNGARRQLIQLFYYCTCNSICNKGTKSYYTAFVCRVNSVSQKDNCSF